MGYKFPENIGEDPRKEIFLTPVIIMQQRLVDPCRIGNHLHARPVIAMLHEDFPCLYQDSLLRACSFIDHSIDLLDKQFDLTI